MNFTDGTSTTFEACERPHVVLDPTGQTPIGLTNGVIEKNGGDAAFTLVRPIATSDDLA